jgi:hypothetical protein
MKLFQNRVLKRMFVPERMDVGKLIGGWRILPATWNLYRKL